MAVLLVIALAISVYLVYQNRQLKQSGAKPKSNAATKDDRTNGTHIYDTPHNSPVQQAQEGSSNYTDLKRPDLREQNEDHVYAHLNHLYENQYESDT